MTREKTTKYVRRYHVARVIKFDWVEGFIRWVRIEFVLLGPVDRYVKNSWIIASIVLLWAVHDTFRIGNTSLTGYSKLNFFGGQNICLYFFKDMAILVKDMAICSGVIIDFVTLKGIQTTSRWPKIIKTTTLYIYHQIMSNTKIASILDSFLDPGIRLRKNRF